MATRIATTRRPTTRIKNKSKKSNSVLPTEVITIENGEYDCTIVEITQQETKYGKALVIKLEGEVIATKITFYKYYNINQGIISGSELYIFLDSMDAIRKGNIAWSKIRGASVTALIDVDDNAKIKVKKLTPANSSSLDESTEDEQDYEEEPEDDVYEDYGDDEDEE